MLIIVRDELEYQFARSKREQELVENGNIVSNYIMKKVLSAIPGVGTYVNGIVAGDKVANGLTNIYNAMDEADCFK